MSDPPKAGSSRQTVEQNEAAATDIYRVSVKVPTFWAEKPAIWFAQIESQFAISNITVDATKFNYVVAQLDSQIASEVEDIIVTPPPTEKYAKLKAELIKRLSVSRQKKVKQLLSQEELGDRRPSQFLRHLQHLAGHNIPDEFLLSIWTSRLPSSVQSIIASQTTESLEVLADLADRVYDVVPAHQVAATAAPDSPLNTLIRQVSELTREMKILKNQMNDRRSRSKSRSTSKSRARSSSQRSNSSYNKYPQCWYHSKFGERANRCIKPCDYRSENDQGTR